MLNKSNTVENSFWNLLNQCRGLIEVNGIKNYLLTLVFLKYLTEENKHNKDFFFQIPAHSDFDYILSSFDNPRLGDEINKCLNRIADINDDLKGVINFVDFNQIESKIHNELFFNLIRFINISAEDLDSQNSNEYNIWANLFDFIILKFEELSGKSFVGTTTPEEVNQIIAKLLNIQETAEIVTVYDPTCGIGNSLISIAENTITDLHFFGQDINIEMASLAKMNLLIHNIHSFEILKGDVLNSPEFFDETNQIKQFDYVVSNPPFNVKSWNQNSDFDYFNRWNSITGIPPNNNGDFAFILHVLASLKQGGRAVVIIPHGLLFRGGNEGKIRRYLIENGYIKSIIGLPSKLHFGTGIPTCLMVLEKNKNHSSQGVFVMDASSEFVKDKFVNKITQAGIDKIIETWRTKTQISEFSRLVSIQEIVDNDYNLNIPRYLANIDEVKIPENSKTIELSDLLASIAKIRTTNEFGNLIKISDLSDNSFLYTVSLDTLSIGEVNRNFYKLTQPALLISKRFSKLKPSFCSASSENPVYISPDVEAFRFINDKIDLSYLILQLNSEFVTKQAESLSIGAAMPSLSRQDILKLKIIVPDLQIQDSIIRQKALAEGAKIQSDKSKIETFQLQNTIDSLLKERMNDFQWTLHDLRNGDLLSIKNKIAVLQKMSAIDNRLNEIIVDINNNVTLSSFIDKLALNVNNLSGVLTGMFDESDKFGTKEKLNLAILLSDFIRDQTIISKDSFCLNDNELRDHVELLEKGQKLFIEFNKNDFLKICTNIFENIKRHSGFLGKDSKFENNIRLVIDLNKKTQEVKFSFMNTGNENTISESDYFSNGGRKGKTSNSGKGGFIIKELALRNGANPFQKSFEKQNSNDFVFEVGLTTKYFLNEI